MVFPSLPFYQDGANNIEHPQIQLPPRPPPPLGGGAGGHMSSIRPNSTSERARLAKIPQPETPLKCPRCESSNTKFCYFNNYNLSQPRHFCKTCRRYWTRGGALRNVPVGGGCRRNKRSKGNRSKSPATSDRTLGGGSSSTATTTITTSSLPSNSCTNDVIGDFLPYNSGEIGLNFGVIPPSLVSASGNQWRLQYPFMGGVAPVAGLYGFDGSSGGGGPTSYMGGGDYEGRAKVVDDGVSQMGMVKNEESNQGLNLARNFLGISNGNEQYWGGNGWTDLNGFTSSSTSHLL